MLEFFSQSFTLTFPILIAGTALIVVLKNDYLSSLNKPIDGGRRLRGQFIFGPNKTWRGVVVYGVLAIIVAALMNVTLPIMSSYVHPLFALNPVIVGGSYALSYVAGELLNSFIKRRIGIESGKGSGMIQAIVDNVDGMVVVAAVLVVGFVVPVASVAIALVLGFALHEVTDVVMKRLRLK